MRIVNSSYITKVIRQLIGECRQNLLQALFRKSLLRNEDRLKTLRVVKELRRVGLVVLHNFVPQERCAELLGHVDAALEQYQSFVQISADGADYRLFGLDAFDDQVRRVTFDPLVIGALRYYQNASRYEGFALCSRLLPVAGNLGSGGGWHRDSPARQQTKLMLYLTDVGDNNGPFQYLVGTHRGLDVIRCSLKFGYDLNQYRFSDGEVARLLDAEPSRLYTLNAPAGTAVLFDSRAIHRGMPMTAGKRYTITSYLWFDQPAPNHVREWTIEAQQRNGCRGGASHR